MDVRKRLKLIRYLIIVVMALLFPACVGGFLHYVDTGTHPDIVLFLCISFLALYFALKAVIRQEKKLKRGLQKLLEDLKDE